MLLILALLIPSAFVGDNAAG
jgi:hypothetical protein